MLRIRDTLRGNRITFNYVQRKSDLHEVAEWMRAHTALGIDTESTGLNCYHPDWQLRTTQIGDAHASYVIPARYKQFVAWLMARDIDWIGHNGPHDIRCIDIYLGYETGVVCKGETFLPAHHLDSRNRQEGGTGHGLKELAIAHVDRSAGKWEVALKKAFKEITIPIPGQVYKSGPRKGQQKVRKAKLSEGWALINPEHPAYIAYAAADPVLTYHVWRYLQPVVREYHDLYAFDHQVQMACDRLQRRALPLDVPYTERLSNAYTRKADAMQLRAAEYGCANIHSGPQIAKTLASLGIHLTERTEKGQLKTDGRVLRELLATARSKRDPERGIDAPGMWLHVEDFIQCVLAAKQVLKRRESYTDAMLREMDSAGRVHPSINTLAARTARMSVSSPPLQQLPTKDRESELLDDSD